MITEPKIVYEDNHIIVVIKPHNISVQEDDSHDLDMLTLIKDFIKKRDNKPGNVFLGLVHRLDRPTGGVMVFAKTSKAASRLSKDLKDKKLKKHYVCIVNGKPQIASNTLTTYLKKDEKTNTVRIAPKFEEGSKQAVLDYEVLSSVEKFSLIKVNLVTGRSHQIRVQMSSQLNVPIFGDFKYGDKAHGGALALWAYELTFTHPVTKQEMLFRVAPDYNHPAFKLFKKDIENLIQ